MMLLFYLEQVSVCQRHVRRVPRQLALAVDLHLLHATAILTTAEPQQPHGRLVELAQLRVHVPARVALAIERGHHGVGVALGLEGRAQSGAFRRTMPCDVPCQMTCAVI